MKTSTLIATARRSQTGFALVATLMLMILLTIIAVGLLTLSTISLRSSSQTAYLAAARSNARLALMMALGDIQKNTGADTRITARADVLDENSPPIVGAWKSWEGTDHEVSGAAMGRPISPGNYKTTKENRFLGWLVSGDPSKVKILPDTSAATGKVILLGSQSVGSGTGRDKLQINIAPTLTTNGNEKGAYAWWVSGENQKVRLPKPYEPSADNSGRWAANAKSHSIADPKAFGLEDLLDDPAPALKAISLKQADFISDPGPLPTSREFYHDLSTSSVGLLTNTATGGWKKDLSLLTENWSAAGTSNLPLFRVKPGEDILSNLPTTGDPTAAKSMIYPWSAYRGTAADIPVHRHGAVTSWENLKDYALAYRDKGISIQSSGNASMASASYPISDKANSFNFLHKVRVLPLIARIQWVFSHSASKLPVNATTNPTGTLYEPRLLLTPVITMWNPYNVDLSFTRTPLYFTIPNPLPAALRYTVNGTQNANYNRLTTDTDPPGAASNPNNMPALSGSGALSYQITSAFSLMPGETRVFSPSAAPAAATALLELKPGYRGGGGHYFTLKKDDGTNISAPATAKIKADAKFDTIYDDVTLGVGIYLNMMVGGTGNAERHLAYRMVYTPEVAAKIYPEAKGLAESAALSTISTTPSPFLTTIFGARMASKTHLAAKGFVQSSPLVNYTAMGGKDLIEKTILKHYGGTNHPVNSPFDYSFQPVTPNDSVLPNADSTTNRGYIVTGFIKADGLSRCVIDELPTRPLQSIAELQNWDLRYENPIPPFSFNIIANSDATPLLPADAVVNSADAGQPANLQHDDSYCANHLLFDDWFFSSIAPDPSTFGTNGRSMKQTYTDFIRGTTPLGNRAYRPLPGDAASAAVSSSDADTLYTKHASKSDSWKSIASRLEVEGMFNVNSTSVVAWRALLGHARNQKIPYLQDSGTSWNVSLSEKSDHAFSRFSVAGDVEATKSGSSGTFPGAAQFSGYRILDEPLLDALAEEVVKQVRKRGPFLSLSEFINRQLSSGDLALAGTVQAALNEIAKKSATNPYKGIEDVIYKLSSATPISAGDAEYKFPEAAVGQSTYGLPGWTRQADVLRAIAPILTARDDTFTIRTYGDARDRNGNIKATSVCEAVVRRSREYVDPADAAEITTQPVSAANRTFGRRYEIISFRWLASNEI